MPAGGATLPLRLYRPIDAGSLPTLVYYFGGGWTLGQIETCDGICRTLANAAGCAVIAVGYRLAPEHKFPVAVHDCYDALGWVAEHAAELGVDAGRLAVGGDSAGGNLAAAVTLLARQRGGPALAAQLLVYPNTCHHADTPSLRDNDDESMFNRRSVDWYWGHYLTTPADGSDPLASPLLAADHAGLPPALVITAEYDPLRDEGEQYAEKLRAAGVPTECTRYDGMMHGFFLMSSMLDGGRRAVRQAVAFLQARLGTAPAAGTAVVSLADYEARARAVLAPQVWDFAAGGSGAETTLRANRQALDAVVVYPRVLSGGGRADTRTHLLGSPAALPVAVAPMAYQRLMHPAGEVAMAEAARAAGVPMMLSALSSCPVEQVAATGVTFWFQLYWLAERHALEQLIERAEAAGSAALVVTLDVPVLGRRLRDMRNGFALPADVVAANLTDGSGSRAHVAHRGESAVAAHTSALFGSALSWADLEWLRDRTSLPLALKGILDPRDARRAVELGADAIVVSNHGGRQSDAAPASVTALPAVVAEVGQACQVLLDSGIRSGTDVLRALALGAAGVLIGRPLLWALAAGGPAGATDALALLGTEVQEALILAGCPGLAAVRDLRTIQEASR